MTPLTELWLPILGSAVLVFIAGFLAWTVLPHHRTDYRQLPNEDSILAALRAADVPPGQYSFPYVRDFKSVTEEMKQSLVTTPSGFVVVRKRGIPSMGPQLVQYFLWLVGTSVLVAYVTACALPRGAEYLRVFQVAGSAAILAHCGVTFVESIWFARPWSVTFKNIMDGVVFGLLTAGVFGWLWPK